MAPRFLGQINAFFCQKGLKSFVVARISISNREDRQEFRHFAQSISGGPEFGQDGTKPEDIVEERKLERDE